MNGKTDGNPLTPVFEKKWKKVKEEAKGWYANKTGAYKLGSTMPTAVQSNVWVQHLLVLDDKLKVDVKALGQALKKVSSEAKTEHASVHVSKFLTDAVPELTALLTEHVVKTGVNVYLYEEKV